MLVIGRGDGDWIVIRHGGEVLRVGVDGPPEGYDTPRHRLYIDGPLSFEVVRSEVAGRGPKP